MSEKYTSNNLQPNSEGYFRGRVGTIAEGSGGSWPGGAEYEKYAKIDPKLAKLTEEMKNARDDKDRLEISQAMEAYIAENKAKEAQAREVEEQEEWERDWGDYQRARQDADAELGEPPMVPEREEPPMVPEPEEPEGVLIPAEKVAEYGDKWEGMDVGQRMDLLRNGSAEDKVLDAWVDINEERLAGDVWGGLSEGEQARYREGGDLAETALGALVRDGKVGAEKAEERTEAGPEKKSTWEKMREGVKKNWLRATAWILLTAGVLTLTGDSRQNIAAATVPNGEIEDKQEGGMPSDEALQDMVGEAGEEVKNRNGYVGPMENGLFATIDEQGNEVVNPEKITPVAYGVSLIQDVAPGRAGDKLTLEELAGYGVTGDVLYSRLVNGMDGENLDGPLFEPVVMSEHIELLTDEELGRFGISREELGDESALENKIELWPMAKQRGLGLALKARLDGMEKRIEVQTGEYYTGYIASEFEGGKLVGTERVQSRGNQRRLVLAFYSEDGKMETKVFVTCIQEPKKAPVYNIRIVETPGEVEEPPAEEQPPAEQPPAEQPPAEEPPTGGLEGKDQTLTPEEVKDTGTVLEQNEGVTEQPTAEEVDAASENTAGAEAVVEGSPAEEAHDTAVEGAEVVSEGDGQELVQEEEPPAETTDTGGASDQALADLMREAALNQTGGA